MTLETTKTQFFKQFMLRAAKVPLIYIFMGITLIAIGYVDDIFPLTKWKTIFDWTDRIGNIFIAFAVLTFVYKFIVLLFKRYERKLLENHRVAAMILGSLRKSLRIIYILSAINIIINLAGPNKFYLVVANDVIKAIIIASIGWIAIQILYTFEAIVYQNISQDKDHKRASTLYTKMHIIRNIATVLIVVVTIAAILMSYSSVRNLGISLLASAGFLTAIIGLAGQKTLFSLFTGLQIVLSQPIRIGDIVMIENESGMVEEITFTHVRVKLGDRRRMIVPINYFIEKSFENWSHDQDSLRSSFSLYVDYMMPVAALRKELDTLIAASKFWDGAACKLEVANLAERCVELRIQVSANNADNLSELRAELKEKLLDFIQEKFPHCFPSYRVSRSNPDEEEEKFKPHVVQTNL